jgi:hypothetical protein
VRNAETLLAKRSISFEKLLVLRQPTQSPGPGVGFVIVVVVNGRHREVEPCPFTRLGLEKFGDLAIG